MAIYVYNCSYAILEKMYNVWIADEEMKCWSNRTGTVLCRLAGKSGQGRVYLLARHGQLHHFAIFEVFNFERGEKLETAILSISILCIHVSSVHMDVKMKYCDKLINCYCQFQLADWTIPCRGAGCVLATHR